MVTIAKVSFISIFRGPHLMNNDIELFDNLSASVLYVCEIFFINSMNGELLHIRYSLFTQLEVSKTDYSHVLLVKTSVLILRMEIVLTVVQYTVERVK